MMSGSPFNPDKQNTSIDSKIIVALERISEAFRVLLWNQSKRHALSPIQIQILIFLNYHSDEKKTVSYLAREFNMSKATVSETIRILTKKQLIRKETSRKDARSYVIQLTRRGRSVAGRCASFARQLEDAVSRIDTEAREYLLSSLIRLIHHLQLTGVITLQRMCLTCIHYRPDHAGHQHYCSLLKRSLETRELRIDCPEHVHAS